MQDVMTVVSSSRSQINKNDNLILNTFSTPYFDFMSDFALHALTSSIQTLQ